MELVETIQKAIDTRKNQLIFILQGLTAFLGILFGLSAFTFFYAEETSYLSDDPRAALYEPQI